MIKIPWIIYRQYTDMETMYWAGSTQAINAACYALWSVKSCMSQEVMKLVYYACFYPSLSYGVIFWGNSIDSTKIFQMQKGEIRIITGSKDRDSCRDSIRNLKIVQFHLQYILSLLLFVVDNTSMHNLNSEIHNVNIRQQLKLHQHSGNLSLYQKEVSSFSIKVLNSLPQSLKKQ
jgi:hypothetical protein